MGGMAFPWLLDVWPWLLVVVPWMTMGCHDATGIPMGAMVATDAHGISMGDHANVAFPWVTMAGDNDLLMDDHGMTMYGHGITVGDHGIAMHYNGIAMHYHGIAMHYHGMPMVSPRYAIVRCCVQTPQSCHGNAVRHILLQCNGNAMSHDSWYCHGMPWRLSIRCKTSRQNRGETCTGSGSKIMLLLLLCSCLCSAVALSYGRVLVSQEMQWVDRGAVAGVFDGVYRALRFAASRSIYVS